MSQEARGRTAPWSLVAATTLLLLALALAVGPGRALATDPEPKPCLSTCNESLPPGGPDLLVVNVGWETSSTATSAPLTASTLDDALKYLRENANGWFHDSAPEVFREWNFINGGSYSIPAPKAIVNGTCAALVNLGDPSFAELVEAGDAAVRAHGTDIGLYNAVIYVWSHNSCRWLGKTSNSRKRIALGSLRAAEHELGHYMGLPHADSLVCKDASGNPVTLSAAPLACHRVEYGNPFDMMGQRYGGFGTAFSDGVFNAQYQNALGWLRDQVVNVPLEETARSYVLKPISQPGQSPRALRIVDSGRTFWLEYRQPIGLDAKGFPGKTYGVLIEMEAEPSISGWMNSSQLLDMTPNTPDAEDHGLPLGQTWVNPVGDAKITVSAVSPTEAIVTVGSQHVRVPDVRGLSFTRAKEVLAAHRLTGGGGGSVKDPTCTNIGVVATQAPFVNDRVFEGTFVNLAIGVEDPKHRCQ